MPRPVDESPLAAFDGVFATTVKETIHVLEDIGRRFTRIGLACSERRCDDKQRDQTPESHHAPYLV